MELIDRELVGSVAQRENIVGRARWWLYRAIKVPWQQSAHHTAGIGRVKADLGRGLTGNHLGSVVSACAAAQETGARGVEHVEGRVIGIRPNAHLGIVWERAAIAERVSVPCPGGIRTGRDSYALQIPRSGSRDGKLRHHPAIGDGIVYDNSITVVVGLAQASESAP